MGMPTWHKLRRPRELTGGVNEEGGKKKAWFRGRGSPSFEKNDGDVIKGEKNQMERRKKQGEKGRSQRRNTQKAKPDKHAATHP